MRFKAAFPEFGTADDDLVNAKIAEAVQLCPVEVWGDLVDQGVSYYTAQALSKSPFARDLKLMLSDGTTAYDERLMMLKRIVTSGYRVVGVDAGYY